MLYVVIVQYLVQYIGYELNSVIMYENKGLFRANEGLLIFA